MREVDSAALGLLNLWSRHAPRGVNQEQDIPAFGLDFGLDTVSRSQGQLPLFVKGKQFSHLDSLRNSPGHGRGVVLIENLIPVHLQSQESW
jgi:hypothetical protein